jgi:hypothetical protein
VYQLVAYLANFRSAGDRVTGVLLYAVDHPTVPPTRIRLLGRDVHVLELNLNQPWQEIDRALRALVGVLAEAEPASAASAAVG